MRRRGMPPPVVALAAGTLLGAVVILVMLLVLRPDMLDVPQGAPTSAPTCVEGPAPVDTPFIRDDRPVKAFGECEDHG